MTITLTREEAQQLLEVFELFLEEAEDVTTLENNLIKMLRTRLAQPDVEDRYCHRLAAMLEGSLRNPERTWDDAHKLLDEYQQAIRQQVDAAGLRRVSSLGKD